MSTEEKGFCAHAVILA